MTDTIDKRFNHHCFTEAEARAEAARLREPTRWKGIAKYKLYERLVLVLFATAILLLMFGRYPVAALLAGCCLFGLILCTNLSIRTRPVYSSAAIDALEYVTNDELRKMEALSLRYPALSAAYRAWLRDGKELRVRDLHASESYARQADGWSSYERLKQGSPVELAADVSCQWPPELGDESRQWPPELVAELDAVFQGLKSAKGLLQQGRGFGIQIGLSRKTIRYMKFVYGPDAEVVVNNVVELPALRV